MKNFDLRDLLVHILHGAIILLAVRYVLEVRWHISIFADLEKSLGSSALFITASYLIGLLIDPLADCVDTWLIKHAKDLNDRFGIPFFPSYYLLKEGECRNLRMDNNAKIRKILSDEAIENDKNIDNKEEKRITGKNKEQVWENPLNTKLLFNHAKSRAFAYGNEYQISRIKNYFQLFIFYRNMMFTSTFSLGALLFAGLSTHSKALIVFLIPTLILLFNNISYKYRAYYCRTILEAVWHNKGTGNLDRTAPK